MWERRRRYILEEGAMGYRSWKMSRIWTVEEKRKVVVKSERGKNQMKEKSRVKTRVAKLRTCSLMVK